MQQCHVINDLIACTLHTCYGHLLVKCICQVGLHLLILAGDCSMPGAELLTAQHITDPGTDWHWQTGL